MDKVRPFSTAEREQACHLLERERPATGADCDECAEYRLALCQFPAWLVFPAPRGGLINPER